MCGFVIVDGQKSKDLPLSNSLYQGTTWGPSLWNHYFADARFSIEDSGFEASVFADDLKAFRPFPSGTSRDHIFAQLEQC